MDIITIITLLLSIFATVIAAIATINSGKLSAKSNTIISRRIEILKEYQQNVVKLYTYVSLQQQGQNCKDFLQIINEIKVTLKNVYAKERFMLTILDSVCDAQATFIGTGDKTILQKSIEHFRCLSDIYELAYWRFIITQTNGHRYHVYNLDNCIIQVAREMLNCDKLSETDRNLINQFIKA